MPFDQDLARPYTLAALTALHFLDARSGGRRFGPDADARWRAFAGEALAEARHANARPRVLTDADRVELLLRDADAQWPGAFGARTVFDLPAVAEDDAFGADWTPLADEFDVSRSIVTETVPDLSRLIARLFSIWSVPHAPLSFPPPQLSSRWLLHGANAVAGALLAFAADAGALWHVQVLVVAESPLTGDLRPRQRRVRALSRQLAALAAGLLNQPPPPRILGHVPADSEHPSHVRFTSVASEA